TDVLVVLKVFPVVGITRLGF
nr:translation elongation factor aEF-1 beta - Sulfolobus solfataricus (fragments) [Saccharolobus solfataricus]